MLPALIRFQVLPLALFAVSNRPIELFGLPLTANLIKSILVSLSFLVAFIALAKPNAISKVMSAFLLMMTAVLTASLTYDWLTFGVFFSLMVLFTLSQMFFDTSVSENTSHPQPSKLDFRKNYLSPILCLAYMIFFESYQEVNADLYYLGLGLLSFSAVFKNIKAQSRWISVPLIGLFALIVFYFLNQLIFIKVFAWLGATGMMLSLLTKTSRDQMAHSIQEVLGLIFKSPSVVIVGYFVILAFTGSLLLHLPIARVAGSDGARAYVDSLFTAMSAVSVTGLGVLDTSKDFSFVGQLMILVLIQLGGLGIAFLSAWILFLNKDNRLSVSHEDLLHNISGAVNKFKSRDLLKRVIAYFFIFEAVGALLLTLAFWNHQDQFLSALWRGVFTSISAFCNAGFALQSDSLIPFQSAGSVLFVVSILIIFGGFAPLMVWQWPNKLRNRNWSLQDKLATSTTATLLLAGFFFFAIVEWTGTLGELGTVDKLVNSWFQSVTTRTAGFNSLDLVQAHDLTIVVFLILMFIGGNPGGAAGGIKTVTLSVIFFAVISGLRGHDQIKAFYRSIPTNLLYQSLLIVFLGLGVHLFSFMALALTQNISTRELVFEVFSALGTVGLSIGATSQLDPIGKLVIIACMLAGRVGPLTFLLLVVRNAHQKKSNFVSEQVSIT